jgi:hypothetical protein
MSRISSGYPNRPVRRTMNIQPSHKDQSRFDLHLNIAHR